MPKPRKAPPARPTAAPESTPRDVTSRKWRRTAPFYIALADPSDAALDVEEATDAHRRAVAAHRQALALAGDDDPDRVAAVTAAAEAVTKTEEALEAARAALLACWRKVTLQSIGARYNALIAEHPPAEGSPRGSDVNPDTFYPALLAACAKDSDLTADQWAAELAGPEWSIGERQALFDVARSVNVGTPDQTQLRRLLSGIEAARPA